MIKLKNVSKFYYNKGVIASGFSKVNLELNMGEFVVITGESGSGKSTLLNVISGLDTYEEGEMYINGEETSHYGEKELEEYRKKYIGNIFQYFYLINSYTVYQNIELVLLINGAKKRDVKKKVLELIRKVDLYKFRNTKVSKLSGGQKQRVAIARALAKNAPIIVADEPTGNLDTAAANSVLKLLSEISASKLVVIVTHNYEQVSKYATRKITMHDGKILEDKVLKPHEKVKKVELNDHKNVSFFNKMRLGIRNTFNIFPKFVLLFLVYFFVTMALFFEYSSNKSEEYNYLMSGNNNYFREVSDKRIIIKKSDKTAISDSDFDKLNKLDNVDYVVKNDILLDRDFSLVNDLLYLYGTFKNVDNFEGKIVKGVKPTADNEIILSGSKDNYYLNEDIIGKELTLESESYINIKFKVVGITYDESSAYNFKFYATEKALEKIQKITDEEMSTITIKFNDKSTSYYRVIPLANLGEGTVLVSEDLNYECKNFNCKNTDLIVDLKNIYFENQLDLKIKDFYNKKNFKKKTNLNYDDYINDYSQVIFISEKDYQKLLSKDIYQSSIFVKDVKNIRKTTSSLEELGYKTLVVSDTLVSNEYMKIFKVIKFVAIIIVVVVLFFVAYFVIKIILKSRNVYFTTLRILGASKSVCKNILNIELINISNLTYFAFLILIILTKNNILNLEYLKELITYLEVKDYIVLYIILVTMSYILSLKFAKKLFKESAVKTYYEEV